MTKNIDQAAALAMPLTAPQTTTGTHNTTSTSNDDPSVDQRSETLPERLNEIIEPTIKRRFEDSTAYLYGEGDDDRIVSYLDLTSQESSHDIDNDQQTDDAETSDNRGANNRAKITNRHQQISNPPTSPIERSILTTNVSPLPGLELSKLENTTRNSPQTEDLDRLILHSPLPGTRNFEHIENAGESSKKRFPKCVCDTALLHSSVCHTSITIRNGVRKSDSNCLSIYRTKCERSMSVNCKLLIASCSDSNLCPLP